MPIIQLYHPREALKDGRKAALASKLTDVLLQMEGNARTEGGYGFAAVLFLALDDEDWWVGGQTASAYVSPPGHFIARVSIPEGYMNQAQKSEVHAAVNAAIVAVCGDPHDPAQGSSIQVVLEEVPEGNWGAGGRTISLASIAEKVGLPKQGERYAWVKAYFDAKARARAAAGYPPDTGGLLPGGG